MEMNFSFPTIAVPEIYDKYGIVYNGHKPLITLSQNHSLSYGILAQLLLNTVIYTSGELI